MKKILSIYYHTNNLSIRVNTNVLYVVRVCFPKTVCGLKIGSKDYKSNGFFICVFGNL